MENCVYKNEMTRLCDYIVSDSTSLEMIELLITIFHLFR